MLGVLPLRLAASTRVNAVCLEVSPRFFVFSFPVVDVLAFWRGVRGIGIFGIFSAALFLSGASSVYGLPTFPVTSHYSFSGTEGTFVTLCGLSKFLASREGPLFSSVATSLRPRVLLMVGKQPLTTRSGLMLTVPSYRLNGAGRYTFFVGSHASF